AGRRARCREADRCRLSRPEIDRRAIALRTPISALPDRQSGVDRRARRRRSSFGLLAGAPAKSTRLDARAYLAYRGPRRGTDRGGGSNAPRGAVSRIAAPEWYGGGAGGL